VTPPASVPARHGPLLVVALGGNALAPAGGAPDVGSQRANLARAVDAIAGLVATNRVVVTHGNGPQVGLLALQAAAYRPGEAEPLDVLGAESEGLIGYLVEQALRNASPGTEVVTLLTQTVVDARDPAFSHPTKPIGPRYTRDEAHALAEARNWRFAEEVTGWRRVVASPEPLAIVELGAIARLVELGVVVICAGGGGIPVVVEGGAVRGAEAVVDKDLASALLARRLGADTLVLLTDVPAVYDGWGTAARRPIARLPVPEARARTWAAGSVGPKVEAACRFVEGGGRAVIGSLDDASRLVAGRAGTEVVVSGSIVYRDGPR